MDVEKTGILKWRHVVRHLFEQHAVLTLASKDIDFRITKARVAMGHQRPRNQALTTIGSPVGPVEQSLTKEKLKSIRKAATPRVGCAQTFELALETLRMIQVTTVPLAHNRSTRRVE